MCVSVCVRECVNPHLPMPGRGPSAYNTQRDVPQIDLSGAVVWLLHSPLVSWLLSRPVVSSWFQWTEEPPWQQVEEAFDNLGHKDCHRNEEVDWPILTAQGHRVLDMPARGDNSLFVLQSLTSDVVAEAFGHSLPPF